MSWSAADIEDGVARLDVTIHHAGGGGMTGNGSIKQAGLQSNYCISVDVWQPFYIYSVYLPVLPR